MCEACWRHDALTLVSSRATMPPGWLLVCLAPLLLADNHTMLRMSQGTNTPSSASQPQLMASLNIYADDFLYSYSLEGHYELQPGTTSWGSPYYARIPKDSSSTKFLYRTPDSGSWAVGGRDWGGVEEVQTDYRSSVGRGGDRVPSTGWAEVYDGSREGRLAGWPIPPIRLEPDKPPAAGPDWLLLILFGVTVLGVCGVAVVRQRILRRWREWRRSVMESASPPHFPGDGGQHLESSPAIGEELVPSCPPPEPIPGSPAPAVAPPPEYGTELQGSPPSYAEAMSTEST